MKLAFLLLTVLAYCAINTQAQTQNNYKFVCYYPNWSYYRQNQGKYEVENIDPFMCTHLIYAFAVLNEDTYELQIYDPYLDVDLGYYQKFTSLKNRNPQLKTLLALGGWNDSQFPKYSELVADPQKVANFITKVVPILNQFNFDGLDVDWEYPGVDDKANFANFIKALSDAFKPRGLMLSIASSASVKTIDDGYDVPSLSQYLDLMHVMAYDFHGGTWEPDIIDHHTPLYKRSYQTDNFDVHSGISAWLDKGFPPEKLIMGIPIYGRSWKLLVPTNTTPPAPGDGPGLAGPSTGEDGYLGFYEICTNTLVNGWTVVQDPEHNMGPYAYGDGEWVGYDDIPMAVYKTRYMKQQGLGGVMIWELTLDDFRNVCGYGINPFMTAIKNELAANPPPTNRTTTSSTSTTTTTPTTTSTTTTSTTTTTTPTTTTTGSSQCQYDGQVILDPTDCHVYYVCSDGTPERFECPNGTAYNPDIANCDWEYNVPSCNSK